MLLREDQVTQKVTDVTKAIAEELATYKAVNPTTGLKSFNPKIEPDLFGEIKSYNIYQKFTTKELYDKIRLTFDAHKMEDIPFEFALATPTTYERESPGFESWLSDSIDHKPFVYPIIPQSGTAAESLSAEEWLVIIVPRIKSIATRDLRSRIAIAIIFSLIIFTAFFLTVRTMLRQKKLSEIKNDFINNMTHEFKTPIATISLAVDALRNIKVQQDPRKMTYFSDIIKEENQRMNRQVETILKSALLDRQEVQLNLKPLNAHQIIQDVADNFMLRLQEKNGTLELNLNAERDLIEADEVHFSNLVNNLLDNAVKYSKENVAPKVCIHTYTEKKNFVLRIEDNGIGMNRETLKRIFEKFYRAHTGNIHNVKGFGLGLSYVKTVVEAHDGLIKADSTLGKGSCFTIELPFSH